MSSLTMPKPIRLFSLVLLILFILSLFPHSAFARQQLFYGDTVAGSISSPGEKDVFEFNARVGDVITIRFAKTSGNLICYVELFDPTGKPIADSRWGVLDAKLASSGTFKITLRDYNNTNTGDYSLSLQRVNNPVGAIELSFGQTATGNINAFAKIISYKFSANTGDNLYISITRLTENSGYFYPLLELFDATGTKLADTSWGGVLIKKVSTTGNFYLLVTDHGRDGTGTYELTLQRTNNPANALTLDFGQTKSGTIETRTNIDAYKFSANAGDNIYISFARLTQNSGDFEPFLELFDATGTKIAEGRYSYYYNILATRVNTTGAFYLLVTSWRSNGTGTYELTLQRTNNPANVITIDFGQTRTGTIETPTKIDAYKFSANAGDNLYISFGRLSGSFDPFLELYDATGKKIAESYYNYGPLATRVNTTGSFYLLVTALYHNGTGTYEFTLQRTNNPANVLTIDFGQTKSGTIETITNIDAYKFSANAGDTLYISFAKLTETSGFFNPYLELFDATGTKLAESSSGFLIKKVSTTGTFYLLVRDDDRIGTGTYEFTLQRTNNPANLEELNYNSVKEDSIESVTKINAYNFTANANETITICSAIKTKNSGNFDACLLELFNTTGTKLASGVSSIKYTFPGPQSASGEEGIKHTFVSGGTFYLFITDDRRDGTGSYNFILLKGNISCSTIDLISPQVSLKLPQADELIESGSKYNITWVSSDNKGITFQEIRLSTDSGLTYPTIIASDLGPNVQSYEWQIPKDLLTAQARIKITAWDAMGNKGEDSNKSDFMIIRTTSPESALNIDYEYDKLQRLTKSTLADIDYGYDELHQPPKNTQAPFNFTTDYSYDALGNRLKLRQTKTGTAIPTK